MSKGLCPGRAEWRFEPGKPAKQLSPHYRLDCDHGTAVMTCWETGGSEPVYLCGSHAEEQKNRENRAGARRAGNGDSGCGKARIKEEAIPNEDSADAGGKNAEEDRPVAASLLQDESAALHAESKNAKSIAKPAEPVPGKAKGIRAALKSGSKASTAAGVGTTQLEKTKAKPAEPASRSANETTPLPTRVSVEPVMPQPSPLKTEEAVLKPAEPETARPEASAAATTPVRAEIPAPKSDENTKTQTSSPSQLANPLAKGVVLPAAAVKAVRTAKDSSTRPGTRDLAFGNPAKAIVDEAIWNLPTGDHEAFRTAVQQGKPVTEAAQTAGGQLAAIQRRFAEYAIKLDAVLLASAKTISVQEAIDQPLEQAMIEIIENDSMRESEKDAVIQQLGALQEWAKYGLHAQITPTEANRGLQAIGERMNWGGTNEVSEKLRPAYRVLFASLKKTIQISVPEAQELHERLVNLHAAKSDLLAVPVPELLPR